MNKSKNTLLLLFFILAAVVVGGLIAEVTSGVPALKWLTYGDAMGFNFGNSEPLLNLTVFKLNFGFQMSISVLQILLICAALFAYRKLR